MEIPKYKRNIRIALRPDQIEDLKFIKHRDGQAGLFKAPGTGKTIVAIRAFKQNPPGLVICRRDDFLTWRLELEGEGVKPGDIYFIDWASRGEKEVHLPNINVLNPEYPWTIITYDLIKHPRIYRWLKDSWFNFVIADEVHMIKRWAAARTKAAIRGTRHINDRIGMTGTPITNSPLDVFSISYFIDDGEVFGTSEFMFLKKYFLKLDGSAWYIRKRAKKEIGHALKRLAIHTHEDSVLKLPPLNPITKSAPMSGMQRRHYEDILGTWETSLSNGETVELNQVVAQLTKLKQIASGFIYDEKRKPHYFRCPKFDLLFALLKDPNYFALKPKIVIWCAYTAEITRIIARLEQEKINAVNFFGQLNRSHREQNRIAFRDNSKIQVFVGQVDMGIGMNELVVADTAIYYSNSLKVLSRQQSERRIRRQGSQRHKQITYLDLVTESSVEVRQLQTVRRSMNLASYILAQINEGQKIRTLLG